MVVRGAPLIGAAAAYGIALAMKSNPSDESLRQAYNLLVQSRPTAVNLRWALDRMCGLLESLPLTERTDAAYREALLIANEDAENCSLLGDHGLLLLREIWGRLDQQRPLQILTHCNAGWLASSRLGDRARANLQSFRRWNSDPRLGRRNSAPQPGSIPDSMGTGASWSSAHLNCRQYRRTSDAARHG